MEVYILDSSLRRINVVDRFESLLWTERYKDIGDFELKLHSTAAHKNLFPSGTRLAMNESNYVMQVEEVESKSDSEGRSIMTVKGRSLELLMEDRMALGTFGDLITNPSWELTGTPGGIARQIFKEICVDGKIDKGDIIPFIAPNTTPPLYFPDTIAEPSAVITKEIEPQSVYAAIKDLCDIYGLGFRLVRNYDKSMLHFDIYTGVDRTTRQDDFLPVIFSPDLENLKDVTELNSSVDFKNVAYVFSKYGAKKVYATGVNPNISGFDRRVLHVNATDIEIQDGPELQDLLEKRGQEELTQHRSVAGFDGEVSQHSRYKYGMQYNLGDLVEMRSSDGVTTNMRVTEQIFASDSEGERSYPTLTIDLFVEAGTWLAVDYNRIWPEAIGVWQEA
jgi:hypothetical protein